MAFDGTVAKNEFLSNMRRLKSNLAFSLMTLLQLSLGIAALLIVHTVMESILLRPLPFPSQGRLVMLWEQNRGKGLEHQGVAPDKFRDWKDQLRSVQQLAAYQAEDRVLASTTNPESIHTAQVSAEFFQLLQLNPLIGRTLVISDTIHSPDTAVISEHLWRDRFGGSRAIIGTRIELGEDKFTVVGVVQKRVFPANADVWIPLRDSWRSRVAHSLSVVGVLRKPYQLADCRLELAERAARAQQAYPDSDTGWSATAVLLRDEILGDSRTQIKLAWCAAFIVLLISCFNVASMMLIRFRNRLGEVALRAAFGATRLQIIMNFLGEPVILGTLATVCGICIAKLSLLLVVEPLMHSRFDNLPPISMDWRVMLFAIFILLVVIVMAGVLPAIHMSKLPLLPTLQSEVRTQTSKSGATRILVLLEIAASVCLVFCTMLAVKSLMRLERVNPGFRTQGISTSRFHLNSSTFPTQPSRLEFVNRLIDVVRHSPGVTDAEVTSSMPLSGHTESFNLVIEGMPAPRHSDMQSAEYRVISPGFVGAMGIPLIHGRYFSENDRQDQPLVTLVSARMAMRYWSGANPIGRRISIDGPTGPWRTIIGVIGDTLEVRFDRDPLAEMYFPISQETPRTLTLVVREKGSSLKDPELRRLFAGLGTDVVPYRVETVEELVSKSLAKSKAYGILLTICAFAAILLASFGLYSCLSSAVNQRTREIGLRMAIGADRFNIVRNFALEGLFLTVVGIGIGGLTGLAVAKSLASQLYGINPWDLPTLAIVIGGTLIVSLGASILPCMRASRVEPAIALRHF